jgi:serine/threonine protein kinase
MRYLHSKGIIHRDLKPENIILDDDRRPRITDFACTRLYEAGVTSSSGGNAVYMAPEVPEGNYDEKADVYSFGLLAYEIITGNIVFDGADSRVFLKLQTGWRPEIPGNVSIAAKDLIAKCWVRDRQSRPMFAQIEKFMEGKWYQLLTGVSGADIAAYINWIEGELQGDDSDDELFRL